MRIAGLYAPRGELVGKLCIARGAVCSRVRGAETNVRRRIKGDATRDAIVKVHRGIESQGGSRSGSRSRNERITIMQQTVACDKVGVGWEWEFPCGRCFLG
jgi:hypothetical protein